MIGFCRPDFKFIVAAQILPSGIVQQAMTKEEEMIAELFSVVLLQLWKTFHIY